VQTHTHYTLDLQTAACTFPLHLPRWKKPSSSPACVLLPERRAAKNPCEPTTLFSPVRPPRSLDGFGAAAMVPADVPLLVRHGPVVDMAVVVTTHGAVPPRHRYAMTLLPLTRIPERSVDTCPPSGSATQISPSTTRRYASQVYGVLIVRNKNSIIIRLIRQLVFSLR
jgi:hypothetical protein